MLSFFSIEILFLANTNAVEKYILGKKCSRPNSYKWRNSITSKRTSHCYCMDDILLIDCNIVRKRNYTGC